LFFFGQAMSTSLPLDHPDAQAQLQAWRREGAWRADPARFHYLEALAQRLQVQGAGVREQLLVKLHSGMADYAQRLAQAREAVATEAAPLLAHKPALGRQLRSLQAAGDVPGFKRLAAQATGEVGCAPLAQLNATLAQASPTLREAQAAGTDAAAVAGIAAHINDFWEPRMRRHFFEVVDAGGAGLRPLVLAAAAKIKRPIPETA
jgi:hypothetical protein